MARRGALDFLGWKARLSANEELKGQPRIQFIYIHHIFLDEIEPFRKLLAAWAEDFTFISHSEAVRRMSENDIDRPYMAFSSDDGFKNNLDAARILEEFGATACFFLNTRTIGLNDSRVIEQFCKEQLHFPPVDFMNWTEVDSLQKRGHEMGSHTSGHFNVAKLSLAAFEQDLYETKAAIEAKTGPIQHFAFPYGRWNHFSEQALQATFDAGFESVSTAERGCHLPDDTTGNRMIFRDHVLAQWPLHHFDYFFEANVLKALKNESQPYQ